MQKQSEKMNEKTMGKATIRVAVGIMQRKWRQDEELQEQKMSKKSIPKGLEFPIYKGPEP